MTNDAPERIAFRWETGAAITSGLLMDHPDYTHYVRADRIEALEAKLAKVIAALDVIAGRNDYADDPWGVARAALAELKGKNQ